MAGSTPASRTGSAATAEAPSSARPGVVAAVPVGRALPRTSLGAEAWRRFRRHRLALVGMIILSVMVLGVVAGPFVWTVPINEIDFKAKLRGPSWSHPLGTDDLGQDLLARMLYGGRI